jgi:Cu(I)/Ag(I) efflux system membrane fusion protein
MPRLTFLFTFLAATALAAALIGCAQEEAPAPPPGETSGPAMRAVDEHGHDHADHAGHDHGEHAGHDHAMPAPQGEQNEQAEALAKLSPEDRALAEKQKICPVSGEPLGSMGKPYKVTVEGRDVLLCCQGCEEEIKENPEKYLAKLDEKQ